MTGHIATVGFMLMLLIYTSSIPVYDAAAQNLIRHSQSNGDLASKMEMKINFGI